MKGDFTRSTFDKKKHYNSVNMQQGRVQVDADWNEQNDINSHHERTFLRDILGKSGTLDKDDGFKISENFSFKWDNDYPDSAEVKALVEFLRDSFDLLWIEENTPVAKSGDGKTLTILAADGSHSATITRDAGKPVVLAIDGKPVYEFARAGDDVWSRGYMIGKGDYYVDGILCENESNIESTRQPDILARQIRFQIFEWESAGSDPIKKAIAGFVLAMFPAMAGAVTVEKTGKKIIITNTETSDTAEIELVESEGKATLKFNGSVIELVAEKSDEKTLIYYQVENPSIPSANGFYLAYLDTWDQHVTHLEDHYMREKALGGVDTATRTRTAWQVRLLPLDSSNVDKCDAWSAVDDLGVSNPGRMQARPKPTKEQTDMCKLYETAGYRGLENHLYRVEVHKGGPFAESTFKWSRDNGIVVSPVTKIRDLENKIEIQSRGRDDNLDFKQDTWIEITDDLHERLHLSGTLVKIKEVKENTMEYYPDKVIGLPITSANFAENPKARRWDSDGVLKPANSTDYIELEDGVEIRLSDGNYRTGDYWLVPARANSEESIEWPRIGNSLTDAPQALLPAGIAHHYAPLAVVEYKDERFSVKSDARSFFTSLADLILIHYAGGDGQNALPNNRLAEPLRVAVTMGRTPISKTPVGSAKVRFTIVKPSSLGTLSAGGMTGSSLEVETNSEGIAECFWTLADDVVEQQVKAEIVECDGAKVSPIYFGATLPIWFYYVAGDGAEEHAGETVDLSVGIAVGSKPPTNPNKKFKVKFTVVAGGTVSPAMPEISSQGIATTRYTLSSAPTRQQIKAELLLFDGKPTNLAPIYFSVGILEHGRSANTGLLKLVIPAGQGNFPLVYGPFKHYLTGLKMPPAVLLGLVTPDKDDEVKYTEDYVFAARSGVHFKPVEINPETFKVHLWVVSRTTTGSASSPADSSPSSPSTVSSAPGAAGTSVATARDMPTVSLPSSLLEASSLALRATEITRMATAEISARATTRFAIDQKATVLLRWWAIPAQEQASQSGEPIKEKVEPVIEFDRSDYKAGGDTVVVTVTDPNLPLDSVIGSVQVLITTKPPTGPASEAGGVVIQLKETGAQTNIYVASFLIREGSILDGNTPKPVPGLGPNTTLFAVYQYEPGKFVQDHANIH